MYGLCQVKNARILQNNYKCIKSKELRVNFFLSILNAMSTRITDLKESVRPIAQHYNDAGFSIVDLINAGFVLLKDKSLDEVSYLIRVAKGIEVIDSDSAEQAFRKKILQILEDAKKIPLQKKPASRARSSKSRK